MAYILIGPWCSGKSYCGKALSRVRDDSFLDLDDIAMQYASEIGWSVDRLIQRNQEVGFLQTEVEWESARSHILHRALSDNKEGVLSLGASYTQYMNHICKVEVQDALAKDPREKILVIPSMNIDYAYRISQQRARLTRGDDWVRYRFAAPSWIASNLDYTVADTVLINDIEKGTYFDVSVDSGEFLRSKKLRRTIGIEC